MNRFRSRRAFTLTEVMAALVLLALGAAVIVGTVVNALASRQSWDQERPPARGLHLLAREVERQNRDTGQRSGTVRDYPAYGAVDWRVEVDRFGDDGLEKVTLILNAREADEVQVEFLRYNPGGRAR